MKVKLLSDVHLEFGDFDPGTGDVLILAGDVCVARELVTNDLSGHKDRYLEFFRLCAQGYNKVFYILGNHEHYHGDFDQTLSILREFVPNDITILHNQSECYRGVHFVGSTLWTNMDNLNMDMIETAANGMNDYYTVARNEGFLHPHDTIASNMDTRDWFDQVIDTLRGPVFMITHHAPSKQSVKGRYDGPLKGAYANDLETWIKKNPNIKYWAHGHIHENNDYQIGNCRVVSNPRGYDDMELNPNFNPEFTIEIEE